MFSTPVLIAGLILWASQYFVAWILGWLVADQMREQFPHESILPLAWHGGIWYDLPLTFWLAWLTARHPEWTAWEWMMSLVIGFAGSMFMHYKVYAPATMANPDPKAVVTQEAHVQRGKVTIVGELHNLFFGMMFGIVINEILFSKNPTPSELWATGMFLVGLLFVGNHMILGIVKVLTGSPEEYRGEPLKSPVGWCSVIGGAVAAILVCSIRTYTG